MDEREAKNLKVGDRVVFRNNGPDDGDRGTITFKNWMAFEVTWDDGEVMNYKNILAMSVHKMAQVALNQ